MVDSSNVGFVCDSKDKYMIYYLFGNAAFNLKEFKSAENLFNKALQINKSNLRPKPKTQSSTVCFLIINFLKLLFYFIFKTKKGLRNRHSN